MKMLIIEQKKKEKETCSPNNASHHLGHCAFHLSVHYCCQQLQLALQAAAYSCSGGHWCCLAWEWCLQVAPLFHLGANMTKWSVHSCRAYKPMLFITFLTWACPIISLLTYYITMYNRYRLVYTTLHRPVATNCNQLPLRFWATTTNKKRRPPVRFSLVQFFMN